jgi:hypothetical protein
VNEYSYFIFRPHHHATSKLPNHGLIALVFIDLLWFCINKRMQQLTSGQQLQLAYRQYLEPYSPYIQYAVTLTLKQSAKISVKRFDNYGDDRFEYWQHLDDSKLDSTLKYFTATLTHKIFGNHSKHANKKDWARPLVIAAVEGRNNHKRTHLHLAIGNIPSTHLGNFANHVQTAFSRCDFANKHICVEYVYDGMGWLGYITKEVGYTNNDALDIVSSTIPPYIQQRICT